MFSVSKGNASRASSAVIFFLFAVLKNKGREAKIAKQVWLVGFRAGDHVSLGRARASCDHKSFPTKGM